MALRSSGPRRPRGGKLSEEEIDRIVARARKEGDELLKSYREQSLRIHPWVCARCGREFATQNLHLLTVHHKDHNHENNPADGSNWENLCIYCHDNEHRRYLDFEAGEGGGQKKEKRRPVTHKPFAKLAECAEADGSRKRDLAG